MKNKFKQGLVQSVTEKQKQIEQQEILHKKHGIDDENKIIVEKSSFYKVIFTVCRISAEILLIMLATIGIIAFIYETPRQDLLDIFLEIKKQIMFM